MKSIQEEICNKLGIKPEGAVLRRQSSEIIEIFNCFAFLLFFLYV